MGQRKFRQMANKQAKKRKRGGTAGQDSGATNKGKAAAACKASRSSGKRSTDLAAVRQKIANHVGTKAFDMVKVLTSDAATKGNLPVMKFLFEMVGLYPVTEPESDPEEKNCLARTLLERLGLDDEVESEEEATNAAASTELRVASSQ
jgi:hypothetical protein